MPQLKYSFMKYLPTIVKEVLGVYHCKFCIFDDKALITGANLSDEYFTNRQDRYHYFNTITNNNNNNNNNNVIVNFLRDFTMLLESQCSRVEYDGIKVNINSNDDDFKYNLKKLIINYNTNDESNSNNNLHRMIILPLIQHSKIGINDESELLPMIINTFTSTSHKLSMYIASPYISFMKELISSFMYFMNNNNNNNNTLTIIAPGQSSHGFHNAKGIKSIVPKLHMEYQKNIVDIMKTNINNNNQQDNDNFKLIEFNREKWTFHSKGIWIFDHNNNDNGNQLSYMSYIGSSNFGQRSWQRDFEIGFIVISRENNVCNKLLDECKHLLKYTTTTTTNNNNINNNNNNNNSSYLIKLSMKLFRSFL
jgi:CDP-diacylglycerol--glycerol-3-phosphate 3-phosphatidyltransferase